MDFEQVQWLNFTIRAQDHGTPPRITELPVYLQIVDVNDNNPFFLQPSYQVLNNNHTHTHTPQNAVKKSKKINLVKSSGCFFQICYFKRGVIDSHSSHVGLSLQENKMMK